MAIPKPPSVFSGGYFRYALNRCPAGISNLFNFNVWTDLRTLASRISWYLMESIHPSTSIICPMPQLPHNPKASWIHLQSSQLARCSTKATPFSLQSYLLKTWPKSYILVLSVQSTLFQKTSSFSVFSFAYFRCLILFWGCSGVHSE